MPAKSFAPAAARPLSLESLLQPVAEDVKKLSYKLLKTRTKLTGEFLSTRELTAESLAATFEAFVTLGGDPATPDTFDWTGNSKALLDEALRELRRGLVGKDSSFGDVRSRLQERPNRAVNDQDAWDAWSRYAISETAAPRKGSANTATASPMRAAEYQSSLPQERDLLANELSGLFDELAAILPAEENAWLVAHYRDGLSQADIARALVDAGRYDSESKALAFVYKKLQRAKERARALLSPRWQALLPEVL